jgi:addiction module RelE/StbE family toxin
MTVRWSNPARRDLERIADYIAQHNPRAAREVLHDIRAVDAKLAEFPLLGRESEHAPGTRELLVRRRYVVTYRARADEVEILQVWHVAQNRAIRRQRRLARPRRR